MSGDNAIVDKSQVESFFASRTGDDSNVAAPVAATDSNETTPHIGQPADPEPASKPAPAAPAPAPAVPAVEDQSTIDDKAIATAMGTDVTAPSETMESVVRRALAAGLTPEQIMAPLETQQNYVAGYNKKFQEAAAMERAAEEERGRLSVLQTSLDEAQRSAEARRQNPEYQTVEAVYKRMQQDPEFADQFLATCNDMGVSPQQLVDKANQPRQDSRYDELVSRYDELNARVTEREQTVLDGQSEELRLRAVDIGEKLGIEPSIMMAAATAEVNDFTAAHGREPQYADAMNDDFFKSVAKRALNTANKQVARYATRKETLHAGVPAPLAPSSGPPVVPVASANLESPGFTEELENYFKTRLASRS